MKILRSLLVSLLGVFGVGVAGVAPSHASLFHQELTEEQQCEIALRKNTIEALEEFLRKFPDSRSACRALALNALENFAPGGTVPGGPSGGNNYGG
jgi:hypothetical protein